MFIGNVQNRQIYTDGKYSGCFGKGGWGNIEWLIMGTGFIFEMIF